MATGGIVIPRSGGVLTKQAENGYPELDLNGGPSGRAFLREFAREIAAEIRGSGIAATSAPVYMDGKAVAKIVTRYQNNNQVPVRRGRG
jgi:hypothetical protein